MRRLLFALALVLPGQTSGHAATERRCLYVVTADARVDKLDTVRERKIHAYDLARRTGKAHLIPSPTGPPAGCLIAGTTCDLAASTFYILVPTESRPKPDGTRDYRILGFSIPGLRLTKELPGGASCREAPHLEITAENGVRAVRASEWLPQTDLDLSGFDPERQRIPNQLLEVSGSRALLRLFTANESELVLAVADKRSRKLVRLKPLVRSVAGGAHLAPGGGSVLVEEMDAGRTAKTGRLALYDSATGSLVHDFANPRIRDLYFLAISPTGKAVYHSGEAYWFLDLRMRFGLDEVARPFATGYPGMFFADR